MVFGFGGPKRDPSRPLVVHVDDEPDIRLMIKAALTPLGVDVLSAEDGAAGIKLVDKEKPALVLLDIRMPGVDGFDACRAIKAKSPGTIVLMLSALSQMKDVEKAVAQGADGYVIKPVEIPALRKKVSEALKLTS